jgi:hypothetical protein
MKKAPGDSGRTALTFAGPWIMNHPGIPSEEDIFMKKSLPIVLLGLVLIGGGLAACSKAEKKPTAGTTPIDQLIQEGKSPVVVGNLFRGISPVAATFTVSVANVSDCPVSMLNGVILFFDQAGAYIPDSKHDMGYSDISPIAPGAKIELQTMTPNDKAVGGQWIIKEVVYEKETKFKEYGKLPMKWTNKNFDAELAAAETKK